MFIIEMIECLYNQWQDLTLIILIDSLLEVKREKMNIKNSGKYSLRMHNLFNFCKLKFLNLIKIILIVANKTKKLNESIIFTINNLMI